MIKNHEDLKTSHEGLSGEVEEHATQERETRAQTNKSLRELGNHADDIERNLEMLDSDVKKNESNRNGDVTIINDRFKIE